MSAAVTHEQLRKELERFATKEDLAAFATKADLAAFATKDDLKRDLEIWAGALEHRIVGIMNELVQTLAAQLSAELTSQVNAIFTQTRTQIANFDDKPPDPSA